MAILVVHGGAGSILDEDDAAYTRGLAAAADAGYAVLTRGETAVDAVLAAVTTMEADPDAFNAGVGGALTRDGRVELDACVMSSDGRAGAVAAVGNSMHPALLAERVRRDGTHVLLVAAGAEALEDRPVANERLITDRSRAQLARWRERRQAPAGSATVGAVALADDGGLAAATSTGGVVGQAPGRVGDAPIPGAGTYANTRAALSCTGKGEAFLRAVTAKAVASMLESGVDMAAALRAALAEVERLGGSGGIIAIDPGGAFGYAYTTAAMAYALRAPGVREEAVGRSAGVRVMRS
ncbi:MAG: isoaspartyl peptidase/L-asparaginase [Trueperaceae bacterium]